MVTNEELTEKINKFREERDWKKFHNPKDLALSLVLEAIGVLEHFQRKNGDQIDIHVENKKSISLYTESFNNSIEANKINEKVLTSNS
jgi:hypothetical protein